MRPSLSDIFEAVQSSNVTYGVVPFENSTNGPVVLTRDLLADRQRLFPDVVVCGEAYLGVHHFLLGHTLSASSTVSQQSGVDGLETSVTLDQSPYSFSHIEHIYSHPQVFGQCEIFLSKYLKNAQRHEVSSTSKAAEIVANESEHSVAIGSQAAAKVHHLDILASGIEDREDNSTRFLILRKDP